MTGGGSVVQSDTLEEDEASDGRALVDVLIEELERLPAQPSVAVRTVWVADQPNSSAKDLAAALTADPALTARVLRLANSAYYGLSRRVAEVSFAVTVVGFPTVRAMAAVHASGLFEPGEHTVPEGYWEHSVATATLCSVLAPRAGVRPNQAFPLGLLHDLGSALLFRADPERFEAVQAEARMAEEHEAKHLLARLEKMAPGFFDFPDALAEFEAKVLAHAEREEQTVFPLLEQRLPPAERQEMAKNFLYVAAKAPSHAHAHSLESAVGNAVLGPVLATIDRVRDSTHPHS